MHYELAVPKEKKKKKRTLWYFERMKLEQKRKIWIYVQSSQLLIAWRKFEIFSPYFSTNF